MPPKILTLKISQNESDRLPTYLAPTTQTVTYTRLFDGSPTFKGAQSTRDTHFGLSMQGIDLVSLSNHSFHEKLQANESHSPGSFARFRIATRRQDYLPSHQIHVDFDRNRTLLSFSVYRLIMVLNVSELHGDSACWNLVDAGLVICDGWETYGSSM